MAISLTSEQVLALAPDTSSLKAARALATPRPWSSLGQQGRSIWGACQGSGKDPYLTQVDWEGPAFKCSCPSRKFPCKHGLALLLLLAEQPALITSQEEPDWVKSWIAGRQRKAEAKVEKPAAPVDEAARAKRAEQKADRVSDGIDLLDLWLGDLVQHGLASAPARGFKFWDQQAARLVDAQAPGAARLVHELAGIAVSGDGWQHRMLRAIGRLVLLVRAYKRLDSLPPDTQADVRAALGFNTPQSDVLASQPVRDSWLIAGQRASQDERVRVQRTWLTGEQTGRHALLLEFAVGSAGFKSSLFPGTVLEADLCFFPGAAPLRAIVKEVLSPPKPPTTLPNASHITAVYEQLGDRLTKNPWTETQPVLLHNVIPTPAPNQWLVVDEFQSAMPCQPDYSLLALSGGRPVDLAGEWDGASLKPLLAVAQGRFTPIRQWAVAP